LLDVQLGLSLAFLGLFLGPAVWLLTMQGPRAVGVVALYPPSHPWTVAAGTVLGWVALALAAAAVGLRRLPRPGVLWATVHGWPGPAAVALLACAVEGWEPGWGYRALMLGWAGYAFLAAVLLWKRIRQGANQGSQISPDQRWELCLTGVVAGTAALLGLGAAALYQDHLWGAAAILVVAVATAVLAVSQRHEAWALASAWSLVAVAALVVWHEHPGDVRHWWGHLIHATLITAGAGALAWLGARRHIYPVTDLRLPTSALLAVHVALGIVANAIVLGGVLVPILQTPAGPATDWLFQAGQPASWAALLLPLAAALWYLRLVHPAGGVHAVVGGGLMLGALAACSAALWGGEGEWLAHHVLTVAWSLVGLAILAAAWSGATLPRVGPMFWAAERRARAAKFLAMYFPVSSSRRWVEGIVVLVVALAVRGAWEDPGRPYWSSGAVLAVAMLLGAMAVWSRRSAYVVASGMMVNVVGFLAWTAWGPGTLATFLTTQVIGLALGSGLWSALELALRHHRPTVDLRHVSHPYSHAAALAALHVLGVIVLGGLASDLTYNDLHLGGFLAWMALAS